MFILRKITGNNSELNFELGHSYGLILQENSPEEFQKIITTFCYDEKECYGFISYGDAQLIGLYKKQQNYIMTDSGNTFSNISFR